MFRFYSSDLVSAFGAQILPIVDVPAIQSVLTQGRRAKNSRSRTVANWATKEIKKLQNAANGVGSGGTPANQFAASGLTATGSAAGSMKS